MTQMMTRTPVFHGISTAYTQANAASGHGLMPSCVHCAGESCAGEKAVCRWQHSDAADDPVACSGGAAYAGGLACALRLLRLCYCSS